MCALVKAAEVRGRDSPKPVYRMSYQFVLPVFVSCGGAKGFPFFASTFASLFQNRLRHEDPDRCVPPASAALQAGSPGSR